MCTTPKGYSTQELVVYIGRSWVAVGLEAPWRERESDAIVSLATLLTLPTLLITLLYLPYLVLLVLLLMMALHLVI